MEKLTRNGEVRGEGQGDATAHHHSLGWLPVVEDVEDHLLLLLSASPTRRAWRMSATGKMEKDPNSLQNSCKICKRLTFMRDETLPNFHFF